MRYKMDNGYIIPYHLMVRGQGEYKKRYMELLAQTCCCQHEAVIHHYSIIKHVNMMADEIVFMQCRLDKGCKCRGFRRDNLLYLEQLANEKMQGM